MFDDLRKPQSGDERSDNEVDTEQFTDNDSGQNNQQNKGYKHIFARLEIFEKELSGKINRRHRNNQIEQNNVSAR